MAVKLETELYAPLKRFLTHRGYEVKAEVRGCDLVAIRPDDPIPTIVEMKRIFTLPLLLQGAERQKTGAHVWLAVERNRTKRGAHNQRFHELTALCRRLGLGFLTVTFYKTKEAAIDVWCEPVGSAFYSQTEPTPVSGSVGDRAAEPAASYVASAVMPLPEGRRKRGTAKLLQEFAARSGDYNVGGSTRRKLVTAYRERSLQCAIALSCHGPAAPRQVREWTQCPTAGSLLRDNVYGWFARVSKGVYRLTPAGAAALHEYAEVTAVWAKRFPWAAEWGTLQTTTEKETLS